MDSLIRNIYAGVSVDTALELLSGGQLTVPVMAIELQGEEEGLGKLYTALAHCRPQRFLFLLPEEGLPEAAVFRAVRFFFLTNYYAHHGAPVLACRRRGGGVQQQIKAWCAAQGFEEPHFLVVEAFSPGSPATADFVYVAAVEHEVFLAFLLHRITDMNWVSHRLLFQANSAGEARLLMDRLQSLVDQLKDTHTGIYQALQRIAALEEALHKSERIIHFQEIEISNHKLYHSLALNAGVGVVEEEEPEARARTLSPEELKGENRILKAENRKLREIINWYKRTYEERSLFGTIKEKLFTRKRR